MPTLEEMKEYAGEVAQAINKSEKFNDAELLEDSITPGGPLPIAFNSTDGDDLVVELNVL